MKVICAGMAKTGTKSMHVALEKLGYSVHDYPDAFEDFETEYAKFHDKGWEVSDFRRMYENVDVAIDGPAYYYWEELVKAFPEAKIILTIRDDDKTWFKSLDNHNETIDKISFYYYPFLSPSWRRFWRFMYNSAITGVVWRHVTGFETRVQPIFGTICKQSYRRHCAHVMNKCPKDRLLIFNCKNGWGSLCEFLGKPVPDEPFPRVNVGGVEAKLFWETGILKQATKEVRIAGGIISFTLAVIGYLTLKRY